jgi:D-alanine-D-alanine ligase
MKIKQSVGVIFGSRSGEHEVSVISAHQVMAALETAGYDILPIYITKEGSWFAGPALNNISAFKTKGFNPANLEGSHRVSMSPDPTVRTLMLHPDEKLGFMKKAPHLWADVFFPVMHGSFGEDGTLQGLLELADVPFAGPSTFAAALTMDKVRTKSVCLDVGIPVLPSVAFSRMAWGQSKDELLTHAEKLGQYPLFVKPVCLGSSIGVSRANNRDELIQGIQTALALDFQVMIEPALTDFIEINCSVMGPPEVASVCEQPVPRDAVLTFEDKYKRGSSSKQGSKLGGSKDGAKLGGAKSGGDSSSASGGMASLDRIIPAPISEELTKEVQRLAIEVVRATRSSGVCRCDFMFDTRNEKLYFNEINTIPGSLAFYLWEASGVDFDQLVSRAVDIAFAEYSIRKETMYSFEANLLSS